MRLIKGLRIVLNVILGSSGFFVWVMVLCWGVLVLVCVLERVFWRYMVDILERGKRLVKIIYLFVVVVI